MKILTLTWLFVVALLFAGLTSFVPAASAQGGLPLWTNRYNGPANGNDYTSAIAVDGSGNVFVTGYSAQSLSGPPYAYATIKYSSAGVPLWTRRYSAPGDQADVPEAIAVDHSGNVFVTGSSIGSFNNQDYLTVKYSGAGVLLWTSRYDQAGAQDEANAIAVDSNNNVIVTGCSVGSDNNWRHYTTIKYSGAGVPLWTNVYIGPVNLDDCALAIAVDVNDNVLVTGWSTGPVGRDYATIKYSSEGVALWTNRYSGSVQFDTARAIAVDSSGNVFVTGDSGKPSATYPPPADYATVAYSGAGVPLWTNRYNGPANSDAVPYAIAVDGSGNVFVTGSSIGIGSSHDYATIKYSGAGLPLWTNRYNGPANSDDDANAIAVDGNGNVFVTGSSYTTNGIDYATIAYSNDGAPLWTNRYNGLGLSDGAAIALDGSGNVFVAGTSTGVGGNWDYATIKYSSSIVTPSMRLDFQRLNNQLVLSWTNAGFSLQSAPSAIGTFTNVSNAASPFTNPVIAPQQFFRLISN
jgi:hypothetical protein